MSKIITGTWKYSNTSPVANGILYLTLSQNATVASIGQIAPQLITIQLNSSGQIPANTSIYANDELTPADTTYLATVIAFGGEKVWSQDFFSITGSSPINLNSIIPTV